MEPESLLEQLFHGIANHESPESIAIRYLQSMQLNFGTRRQFNITDVFPAYFNQSVRYLDLSRNDIESITGNFILMFPKLKYLDISYNKLTLANKAFTSGASLLLFHPSIQVIVEENQGKDDFHRRVSLGNPRRKARDIPNDPFGDNDIFVYKKLKNCSIKPFMSLAEYCQTVNCVLSGRGDFVPCKYVPLPTWNWTNTLPIIVRLAPKLQQLRVANLWHNTYPKIFLDRTASFQVNTNLKSVDLTGSNDFVGQFDYHTPDVHGVEGLEEFKMANVQLFNRPHYDMSELSMLSGLKRLYLSSNSLFIPADFRLCHNVSKYHSARYFQL